MRTPRWPVGLNRYAYVGGNPETFVDPTGAPACGSSLTPGDTGSLSGAGARYSASYSYDTRNRLTSAPLGSYSYGDDAHVDAATAVGATWTASYDAAGNMTCRAASSATTCAGSSPTGALLSYDNEGRLASWQNAPTAPTSSASFLYDGAGQRVAQVATSGGTTTTTSYLGSLEEITTSGGATTTTAYYGGVALSVNGALSYTLVDGLGSVSARLNTRGAVSATQLYGPYGSVRYQSGTLPTDQGFTGQRGDATSGLDYDNARYYDPIAGQFTSADTTLAGGANRYAYVAGNPETFVDPSGQYAQVCDTATCVGQGTDLPAGATGVSESGSGSETVSETEGGPSQAPTSGGRGGLGAVLTFGVVAGLFMLGVDAMGYVASQGVWHIWQQWQAHLSAPPTNGVSVDAWVAHGVLPSQSSGSASGSGSGGSGGSGAGESGSGVSRLPPPTENGQASGLGAPILSDEVLAECDPQLPTAQFCIGYTRFASNDAKPVPPPLPSGAQNLADFGHRIVQWGRGDADALARIGNLSADDLRAEGMTSDLAGQWRDFYIAVKARNPGNPSAGGRSTLMDWVSQLLSSGE